MLLYYADPHASGARKKKGTTPRLQAGPQEPHGGCSVTCMVVGQDWLGLGLWGETGQGRCGVCEGRTRVHRRHRRGGALAGGRRLDGARAMSHGGRQLGGPMP